jgi:hypothetical protein
MIQTALSKSNIKIFFILKPVIYKVPEDLAKSFEPILSFMKSLVFLEKKVLKYLITLYITNYDGLQRALKSSS